MLRLQRTMVGESALITFSSSGRSLARAHQPAVRNVIAHEDQAPREVQPERRVEVLLVDVLPLDDRGSEPLLHEPVDEGDVHEAIATTPKSRGPRIAASTNVKTVVRPR